MTDTVQLVTFDKRYAFFFFGFRSFFFFSFLQEVFGVLEQVNQIRSDYSGNKKVTEREWQAGTQRDTTVKTI